MILWGFGSNLGAIARRLYAGGMNLRDVDGKTTTYGELSHKAGLIFDNGMYSSIALATMLGALTWDRGDDLLRAWRKLEKDGWMDAIDAQYTWLPFGKIGSTSNMNMAHLALTVIALEDLGKSKKLAMSALRDFRRKTRGMHNGAYLALYLLSGNAVGREDAIDELRDTLLDMSAAEVPWEAASIAKRDGILPIERREVSDWSWKVPPNRELILTSDSFPSATKTYTRADWLFAYWLARAAGALSPES